MDDLANFDFAPPGMREREAALLERADIVFAGGRTLYRERRAYGAKVRCHPSGVELERFAANDGSASDSPRCCAVRCSRTPA